MASQHNSFTIEGNLVDVWKKSIYPASITVENGRILAITPLPLTTQHLKSYLLPGFVDSHVHIESSMLVPSEFARLAVVHGTIGTVSDPHEIANVCGLAGVDFMIDNGKQVPFKFNFGAPSCVPATIFETAGASLDSESVAALLARKEIRYLSEMMNFPGVLHQDAEVMKKIAAAHQLRKPVDGHAPGLRGDAAKQYIEAGISTDNECFTAEEALDKLQHGMKIIIREGSAAKNFEALIEILDDHPKMVLFCSDDKHPDSLVAGHINQLCARAVAKGIDIFKVLMAACVNPVLHYQLEIGLLRVGDAADFIVAENLVDFNILQTYIDGQLVANNGQSLIPAVASIPTINQFDCKPVTVADLAIALNAYPSNNGLIPVMEALDGQLITNRLDMPGKERNGQWVADTSQDLLKMVVVNRYHAAPVAKCFIHRFGFERGAIASSVAHDSHNIVAIGADDESLARAINLVIAEKGGVSCCDGSHEKVLGLPVAGLMSANDGYAVAAAYFEIDAMAKSLGSKLGAPFMTLSFMALLVIPHLKLSDKGLFDGDSFTFI